MYVNGHILGLGEWRILKTHHTLSRNKTRLQQLHGYKASRGGPAISHLFFADDSLVFCKATEDECKTLMQVLNEYQKASGQAVNFAKSAITFAKGTQTFYKLPTIKLRVMLGVAYCSQDFYCNKE